MSDDVEVLVLDLLEWLGTKPRPYLEVMDAWRTSCPKLPVWEEANERGFVERRLLPGEGAYVKVTWQGSAFLQQARPSLRVLS
jgi:hypothetical protein